MTDILRTIAAYVPPGLARSALTSSVPTIPTQPQSERFPAAVLFADVSGFTPLTEALAQKGTEGPEELTRLLNRYFSWMIAFVETEGGEVVKFGGDALTVMFPARDEPLSVATRRAMQAAESMQSSMEEFGIMESSVGLVTLKMKIGIGAGELLQAQVGGVNDRWEYIIAGEPLRQAAQAEQGAAQGEIVLSPEAKAIISPENFPTRPILQLDLEAVPDPSAAERLLRCYIPKPVRSWLDKELHGWLATLRPMSVLFVGVKGLDYHQPEVVNRLHNFFRAAQEVILRYQGALPRLTVDDKGTVLLILFGAPPHSHEDDPERALRCALDLQGLAQTQDLHLAIGVTTGRVFAGPVGGISRREYTVMGDAVNLAARLMVAAEPDEVCCNYETYRSVYGRISFELLPPVRVKGKAGLIRRYRPTGDYQPARQLTRQKQSSTRALLIGRQPEMERLLSVLDQVQAGQSRVIILEGEAGIGKTQLIVTLSRYLQRRNMTTLLGMGRSIEQDTPYRAWRDIFRAYFNLPEEATTASPAILAQIKAQVQATMPSWLEYLPLFNDILDLNFPPNETVANLDEASRRRKQQQFLLTSLQPGLQNGPLTIILEDAHWLDPFSWELVSQIARLSVKDHFSLLLIVVMRPLEGTSLRSEVELLTRLENTDYLRLDSMTPDETLNVAAKTLGLTGNELPEAVAELVRQRAGGNPFFAEELVQALYDNGVIDLKSMKGKMRCLISGDIARAAQTLPPTIQNVILSRIDQLPPEKQLTIKVAAVIGQTFAYETLRDTLKEHLEFGEVSLREYLNDLIYLDLIRPSSATSPWSYAFKHSIIREVTYQSLLFDRRRQLHSTVARWYETTYGPDANEEHLTSHEAEADQKLALPASAPPASTTLAPYHALLVYHWHQAEDDQKEQHYAALVALQAVREFANAEAVGYLNRAIDLTLDSDLEERYKLLLARETVFDRQGDRERQAQDLGELARLARSLVDPARRAEVALRQAYYATAISKPTAARAAVEAALTHAHQVAASQFESRAYIVKGTVLLNQGDYKTARESLAQALTLAQTNQLDQTELEGLNWLAQICLVEGDYTAATTYLREALAISRSKNYLLEGAQTLSLQGLLHYYLGDYPAALSCFEQVIPIYYITGNRQTELKPFYGIGLIRLGWGDYEAARDYFEHALDIQREIEDRNGAAETMSHLGLVYCHTGDYNAAQSYLGQALGIYKEIGNRTGEADTLSKLAFVYHSRENYQTTQRYCEMALTIYREIDHRRGQSYGLTYLGHALAAQEQFDAAASAYRKALRLRKMMHQSTPAIDILAGLANVNLYANKPELALNRTKEILAWLTEKGVAGVDDPLWALLKCHEILEAQDTPDAAEQAQETLAIAHTLLQTQAATLRHEKVKQNFLTVVKTHRRVLTLWPEGEPIPETTLFSDRETGVIR